MLLSCSEDVFEVDVQAKYVMIASKQRPSSNNDSLAGKIYCMRNSCCNGCHCRLNVYYKVCLELLVSSNTYGV